tara:strand:+ start:105 stop:722 length:618 start_codon:yes stop_codon:yes gene_type:complete
MSVITSIFSHKTIATITTLLMTGLSAPTYSDTFPQNTRYQVCFTPGGDCTSLIVKEIHQAHQSIKLQAYSFTSKPIARAIAEAKDKGIEVTIVLDKSQSKKNKYSATKYLLKHNIPIWVDYAPAIAHNKVIVIDQSTVITGSFNFTHAAQYENAENILVIHDPILAEQYSKNLLARKVVSKKMRPSRAKVKARRPPRTWYDLMVS